MAVEGGVDFDDLNRRMEGALSTLQTEFAGLRTGRASASLVEPISVNAYGSMMPMNQVGTVSVPESRMLSISIWDKGLVAAVEKAIRESGLGLNPVTEGQTVRITIPELNEERRVELSKVGGKYAEGARVAVRNVRRDGMEHLKKAQKDKDISEDEQKELSIRVQTMTDDMVKRIDEMLATKETEIMQV